MAAAMALFGALIAAWSYYQVYRFKRTSRAHLEARFREVVGQNAALVAALRAQKHPQQSGETTKHAGATIRQRAVDHFRKAGVIPLPDIDYELLGEQVSLGDYYQALEALYFNSPRELAILSRYAQNLVHSETPTVMILDLVGFGDFRREQGTLPAGRTIEEVRKIVFEASSQRQGSMLSSLGDSFLVVFSSTDSAFNAAKAIQQDLASSSSLRDQSARIALGVADWRRPESLREIYDIESLTAPGAIGLTPSLEAWAQAGAIKATKKKIATGPEGRTLEFIEVDPRGSARTSLTRG